MKAHSQFIHAEVAITGSSFSNGITGVYGSPYMHERLS